MRAYELAQRVLRQLGHVLVRLGGDLSQLSEQGSAHAEIGAHGVEILALAPTADPHAYPAGRPLAERIAGSRYVEIEGGMVPLPDQMPARFAELVTEFLQK